MRERPVSHVPKLVLLTLGLGLCAQLAWDLGRLAPQAKAEDFPPPPSSLTVKAASFGESIAMSKALMLYVQAFDNQPGISVPLRNLDVARLQAWLDRILDLDPRGQYPLFAASRLYGDVGDAARQRQMSEFVYQRFFVDPNHRWQWLAHAAVTARHDLKDLPLARKYAQAIRLHATARELPPWARNMEILLLEDMNELDAARTLIGALLQSGQIVDEHELRFLDQQLKGMNARARKAQ